MTAFLVQLQYEGPTSIKALAGRICWWYGARLLVGRVAMGGCLVALKLAVTTPMAHADAAVRSFVAGSL